MTAETMPEALDGERIDRVVALITGASRSEASALVEVGSVRLDGRVVRKPSARVATGQVVDVSGELARGHEALEPDTGVAVSVVYVDDAMIVVDKQAGLVVHPGAGNEHGTLVHGLLARYPDIGSVGERERPGIVHRLDKGTSGLLVVARTEAARSALIAQLARRMAGRRYAALVWGHLDSPAGLIDAPIGRSRREPTRMATSASGREARTRYEVVQSYQEPAPTSSIRCQLETGRTHQIRVHLAAIGHPLVGDERYGGRRGVLGHLGRPFLHSEHLELVHPTTGEPMAFDSPLPADLAAILAEVR